MIALERRDGRPLRIGHRGAAALAPENTIRAFRAARDAGVDAIELDLLRLDDGEIVVAHSNDLLEVSHGRSRGTVLDKSVTELRETCPELPTLDDALAWFVDEAAELGVHADVKSANAVVDVGGTLRRFGLEERAFVTCAHLRPLRTLARREPGLRGALTFPRAVMGISDRGTFAPVARGALWGIRSALPLLVGILLRSSRTSALSLHHSVVTARAVERAHALGAAVIAWTVDDPSDLARMDAAGVDAVVSNDPGIFASTLRS
ncbi:MAG: glycerophosphodiester phosphodiesterase [Gaiellaceae bacterium]